MIAGVDIQDIDPGSRHTLQLAIRLVGMRGEEW